MSQLRNQLRKLLPRFSKEANKIVNEKARSRWGRIQKITQSTKSLAHACRFHGMSEDTYSKWGKRVLKRPRAETLLCKSRRPYRSPNKTKPKVEKQVLKVRRVEPYLGPDRISHTIEKIYDHKVPPSTVFAILRRAKVVAKNVAEKLTKKHLKRYRRSLPGYLQMDFKYVPYLVEGKKLYQLSCIDHHSSWRLIRCYQEKSLQSVISFLNELKVHCPFGIIEIQTDNDTAFTDKFSSGIGVTGLHKMDEWCRKNDVIHRLIPVGVKELNGKVENTHKQDDREFFAMNHFTSFNSIEMGTKGYNDRWNNLRATKALAWKTPSQIITEAYVKVLALILMIQKDKVESLYRLDNEGNAYMPIPKPKIKKKVPVRTRKPSTVEKYLKYLEWADKKKLPAILTYPTMSLDFSILA